MRKISLQWRLTVITALLIAAICIFLNFLLYRNGIYYIDSLQNVVTTAAVPSRRPCILIFRTVSGMISLRSLQCRYMIPRQAIEEGAGL